MIRFKSVGVLKGGQRKQQMSSFAAEGLLLDRRLIAKCRVQTFGREKYDAWLDLKR